MASVLVTVLALVLIVPSLTLLGIAAYARRYWGEPAGLSLSVAIGVTGFIGAFVWAATFTVGLTPLVLLLIYPFIPFVWAVFALEYLGRTGLVTRRMLAAFTLLPLYVILQVLASSKGFGVLPGGTVETVTNRIRTLVEIVLTAAAIVLTWRIVASSYREYYLETREGLLIAAGWLAPFFAIWLSRSLLFAAIFRAQANQNLNLAAVLPWTEITVLLTGGYFVGAACLLVVVWYGSPLDAIPATKAVSTDRVVAEMDQLVIVIDEEEDITDLNTAAERVLGIDSAKVAGVDIDRVLGYSLTDFQDEQTIPLAVENGTRYFQPRATTLTDQKERLLGWAITLTDVTERRMREQRLEVLNRVLRHNVRNDMTAIRGYAERIKAGADTDSMVEKIRSGANEIISHGEKARDVERLMEVPTDEDVSTDLSMLVRRVVAQTKGSHEAEITTDVPSDLEVNANKRLLSSVLENLVENAVQHCDVETPEVTIEAIERDGSVEITVADNGPGIPDQELNTLAEGTESDLQHGSGIGLWAVKWSVTRMGGDVWFEENEPRGTVVRIQLPAATTDEPTGEEQEDAGTTDSAEVRTSADGGTVSPRSSETDQ